MTEAHFSGKRMRAVGAIMLAAFLPKCQYVANMRTPLSDDPLICLAPPVRWCQ